jgi:hypothetical protein
MKDLDIFPAELENALVLFGRSLTEDAPTAVVLGVDSSRTYKLGEESLFGISFSADFGPFPASWQVASRQGPDLDFLPGILAEKGRASLM